MFVHCMLNVENIYWDCELCKPLNCNVSNKYGSIILPSVFCYGRLDNSHACVIIWKQQKPVVTNSIQDEAFVKF